MEGGFIPFSPFLFSFLEEEIEWQEKPWLPLRTSGFFFSPLQGKGRDSSSCGFLPDSSVGPGSFSQTTLFWTFLPSNSRGTACFNRVIQKAMGRNRQELWNRILIGLGNLSVPNFCYFCNVAICRLSWCYFLWWPSLYLLFSTSFKVFILCFKTLASCLHHRVTES